MRDLDAGQVVKLVGLAKASITLGTRFASKQSDSILADRVENFRPPRGEFVGRKIGSEKGYAFLSEGDYIKQKNKAKRYQKIAVKTLLTRHIDCTGNMMMKTFSV